MNIGNFFSTFIIDPFSKELPTRHQVLACAASIFLGILFCGMLHLRSFRKLQGRLAECKLDDKLQKNFDIAATKSNQFGVVKLLNKSTNNAPNFPVSRKNISKLIQDYFINPHYKQPFPSKNKVKIPLNGKKVRWRSLKRDQKVAVINKIALPHNRIRGLRRFLVDHRFFANSHSVYTKGDPRKGHGVDHAVRTAIFTGIFAALYAKYHPGHEDTIQQNELMAMILAGAGHDSGRQADGPDLFDEFSAIIVKEALENIGIKETNLINNCVEAVADKDKKDLTNKSFIAKCVQNADCAEYARCNKTKAVQNKKQFDHSRNYLDIYRELAHLAENDKNYELKNGLTFGDFLLELDAIRTEMNRLIHRTNSRQHRKKMAAKKGYAFDKILRTINSTEFPLLSDTLDKLTIKPKPSAEEVKAKGLISQAETLQAQGISLLPFTSVENMLAKLVGTPAIHPKRRLKILKLRNVFQNEINVRQNGKRLLEEALNRWKSGCSTPPSVIDAFFEAPPTVRDGARERFLNIIGSDLLSHCHQEALYAEHIHGKLKSLLESEHSPTADQILEATRELLEIYYGLDVAVQDPRFLTTCALAYEKAASIHQENDPSKAAATLQEAADQLILNNNHFLQALSETNLIDTSPQFLLSGTSFVRKQRLRVQKKKYETCETIELSIELTSCARADLETKLPLLSLNGIELKTRRGGADYFDPDKGFYRQDRKLLFGQEHYFTTCEGKVEVSFGSDSFMANQYRRLCVKMLPGATMQDAQKALSLLGLPMALMPSRPEDIRQEALQRSMAARYPAKVYSGIDANGKKKPWQEAYGSLTEHERATIEQDIDNCVIGVTGPRQLELINPTWGREALRHKARAAMTFIQAGTISTTAKIIGNIAKTGLLSEQERLERGIFPACRNPDYNNNVGAANQTFTRIITQKDVQQQLSMHRYFFHGPVMLVWDVQSFERMPYSYPDDHGGLSSPRFFKKLFKAGDQPSYKNFTGAERLADRKGFTENLDFLEQNRRVTNETMFDTVLGPQYLSKIVVWKKLDKKVLAKRMEKMGIHSINGKPLNECIIVADKISQAILP